MLSRFAVSSWSSVTAPIRHRGGAFSRSVTIFMRSCAPLTSPERMYYTVWRGTDPAGLSFCFYRPINHNEENKNAQDNSPKSNTRTRYPVPCTLHPVPHPPTCRIFPESVGNPQIQIRQFPTDSDTSKSVFSRPPQNQEDLHNGKRPAVGTERPVREAARRPAVPGLVAFLRPPLCEKGG